ncbi:MAG TPA: 50S ribosomal protein L23 [Pseudomonadales bacterium]|nr:50S ribosomal protein L23 [Pseudomonadales bacterium]
MNQERVFSVLLGPHVSEKSTAVAERANQYVFRVARNATKPEIRTAVEQLFKVKVLDVSVLNVKGKVKLNRNGVAKRSDWKKAYVRLEAGQDIDFTVTD